MTIKLTASQKKQIAAIVEGFEVDPAKKTDYANMSAQLIAIGLTPNNDFIWYCINKVAPKTVEYDMDFL